MEISNPIPLCSRYRSGSPLVRTTKIWLHVLLPSMYAHSMEYASQETTTSSIGTYVRLFSELLADIKCCP